MLLYEMLHNNLSFENIYFLLIYVIIGGIPMKLFNLVRRKRYINVILKNKYKALRYDKKILASLVQIKNPISTLQDSDIIKIIQLIQQYEGINANEIDKIIHYYKCKIELQNIEIEFWKNLKIKM